MKFRYQQLLISAIGAALIIPLEFFLGVMFTFSFTNHESTWAWAFDIISFWSQIPGIVMSFFTPRIAAAWMLVSLAISICIGIAFEIFVSYSGLSAGPNAFKWLEFAPRLLKTAAIFWGVPLVFALLLARRSRTPNSSHRDPSELESDHSVR